MSNNCDSLNISFISEINSQSFFEGLKNLIHNSTETSKLFCIFCKKTPILEMQSLTSIKVTCDCNIEEDEKIFNINEVIEKFIIDLEDFDDNLIKEYEKYFKCIIHDNLFHFFCNKCNKNICQECYKIHNCYKEEDIIDFNAIHYQICKICIFIDNSFNEDDPFKLKESNSDEMNLSDDNSSEYLFNLKRLISTLIYEYNTTPNKEIIQNLKNIYDRLSKNINLFIKGIYMNINFEIFSEYEYFEKNTDENKHLIKKIEIPAYNFNINILKNEVLINLEILNLKGNNLSDISQLATVQFHSLKILNLNSNQISDNMIQYIYKFNFPKLENLDLGINNLKNYDFFKSIEHFHNLKQLNLTSNFFNKKIPDNWNIKEINLLSLEKIDFSNGIFSEETINTIFPTLKFELLTSINLMSNNIRTLNFIKKLKNCPIEILNLANNDINEKQLIYLYDFSELKEIHLKNNLIKNIDEVNELVKKIENLERIIITGNNIDLYNNKEQEDDIIDEINDIFDNIF